MLSHEIIKFKEKIVAYSQPWSPPNYENTSNIKCQEHLEEFLEAERIKEGTFVRYKSGAGDCFSRHQMNVVLCVQRDFSKVHIGYTRFPETHLLLQCNISEYQPWIRWVDIRDYIEVSPETKAKFVNDKLLDYIEKTKSTSTLYKEASPQSCWSRLQAGDAG